MYTLEEITKLEAVMRPNISSVAGFLNNTDSLIDIINNDSNYLNSVGITHKQIGDRLDAIIGKYLRFLMLKSYCRKNEIPKNMIGKNFDADFNFTVIIDDYLEVSATGWCGGQSCPFKVIDANDKASASYDFTITNLKTSETIDFSALLPHLIREHKFFEGTTSYRLEPKAAISVLELKKGVNYFQPKNAGTFWKIGSSITTNDELLIDYPFVINLENAIIKHNDIDGIVIITEYFKVNSPPVLYDGNILMVYGGTFYKSTYEIKKQTAEYINL